jgi:hypothetical protein
MFDPTFVIGPQDLPGMLSTLPNGHETYAHSHVVDRRGVEEVEPTPRRHFSFSSLERKGRNSFETVRMGRGRKMTNAGSGPDNPSERKGDAVRRLIRRSRMLEVLTFVVVILISPASFVFGLPFGIAPHDWLATWTHWTVVFITVAFFIVLFGFETALSYRLKAQRVPAAGHN